MKTLLLLRHSKAAHDTAYPEDSLRPLTKRGVGDAELMGKALRKLECEPDQIFCSPAVRTRETIETAMEEFRHRITVEFEDTIYEATPDRLIKLVSNKGKGERVLVVGHNPGMQELVGMLTGGNGVSVHFPTSALARVDFELDDWSEVERTRGELVWLITPEVVDEL